MKPLKKTIYSLGALQLLMLASNRRYLQFLSDLDADVSGTDNLKKDIRKDKRQQRAKLATHINTT